MANRQSVRTQMIIVAAPSGAGKSSFVERICRELSSLKDTVTYTTRSPRTGESEGKPYHFISEAEFEKKKTEGFFIEWARVHSHLYGTPKHQLQDAWNDNKCIIMDVDVQGARTFKAKYPSAATIFILPPSIEELRRRITKRDPSRLPPDLELRLKNAEIEISQAKDFDFRVVNDDFSASFQEFKKIVEGLL